MLQSFPEIKDGFHFECTLCGDCCVGDQEVLLNLSDLYNMAQFLSYPSTAQLFANQWVELVQDAEHTVWRPRIKFKTRPFKFCPFLMNETDDSGQLKGLCQLHPEFKPLICFMAPVGCVYDAENHSTQFILVPPTEDCPGMEQPEFNHLNDYLRDFEKDLHYQELFFEALEQLKKHNLSPDEFRKYVYEFPVKERFDMVFSKIAKGLKRTFKITLPL